MGTGFTGVTTCTFNTRSATFHVVDQFGTQISATVPSGATTGPICLQKPGFAQNCSADDFIVIGAGPYVSDFSPTNASPGTTVTINGAHFGSQSGNTLQSIKFNGTNSPSISATSDTICTATVPNGVTTGPLTVTTSLGSYTTSNKFYVAPVIASFSPAFGKPGTNVVIKGTNFTDTSRVAFGTISALYTINNNNQITATVPAGAVDGTVRVTAPAGQSITSSNFIVLPDITSISPIAGNVNTTVTITGANLNVGSPTVRFNGVLASIFGSPTFSQIQAFAPAGSSSGPVTVQTSDGIAVSPTNFYYPPTISGFLPLNGGPGTMVTISGQNFTNASSVVFNSNNATAFTVVNNTTITATVPAGAVTGPISVTTPGGTIASAQTFFGTPVITGFSPSTGVVGIPVTISGINFSFFTNVLFNGIRTTNAFNTNDSFIFANVPLGATTGLLTVQTPGGNATSSSNFNIMPLLLSITNLDANTVAISWTTNAPGFFLQSSMGLQSSNNVWSNELAAAQIIGGKVTVTNSVTNAAQKYYRLRN